MKKSIIYLMLSVSALSAYAAPVYKCDKNGVTTYTNAPCSGNSGSKVDLPELSITSGFKHNGASSGNTSSGQPAAVQVKTTEGQKQRDSKRNEILADELRREEEALTKAEKTLAEQKDVRNGDEKNYQKVLDRIKPFEDEVALRKKNIDALKKEMGTDR